MADSKRRGEDAADDRLDDEFDDLDLDDEQEDEPAAGAGGSRTATKSRAASAGKKELVDRKPRTKEGERPNVFARLVNFIREVVAELRKVIWPTRSELLTYTTVVVVFVAIMLTIVASLDYAFGKLVFAVFAGDTDK